MDLEVNDIIKMGGYRYYVVTVDSEDDHVSIRQQGKSYEKSIRRQTYEVVYKANPKSKGIRRARWLFPIYFDSCWIAEGGHGFWSSIIALGADVLYWAIRITGLTILFRLIKYFMGKINTISRGF